MTHKARNLILSLGVLAAAVSAVIAVASSCSIESPSAGEESATKMNHSKYAKDKECTECHEADRPTPLHGKGVDCGVCHESHDDLSPFVPKEGITSSGDPGTKTDTETETDEETETDTDTDTEGDPSKVFDHPAGLTSCVACHEKDRAPPPHVESGDCVACHEPSNTGGPWKPK
jgi:cytochrome c553